LSQGPSKAAAAEQGGIRERLQGIHDPIALLEGLFAHSPVPYIIFKSDGHPLLNNRAYREMFGAQPPPEYNLFHDEVSARTGLAEAVRRAFKGETITAPAVWYDPRDLQHIHVTDARRAAISCTFFPLFGPQHEVTHVAIAFKDVTAELEAREHAEAERDHLRAVIAQKEQAEAAAKMQGRVLESMTEGVSVTNEDGIIIYTNPAEDRIFGYERGELIGKHVSIQNRYPPGENARVIAQVIAQLKARGEWEGEWSNIKKDGTPFTTEARITALDLGGRPHFVCVQRDVTLRKQSQEFEQQVVGIVSHDLRNPLSAIGMSASLLLKRGGLDEQQGKVIGRIISSTERAQRMIRDFLDFTQARTDPGIPLCRTAVDLHEIVQVALDEVHLSYPERQVILELSGDGGAVCDPDRIAQAIGNLIANAFQHGAISSPVRVVARGSEEAIVLEVTNAGPPIRPEELPNLFVPFRRGRESRERVAGSIGLGLYITQRLVLAHGGAVKVRSTEEEGTTFTVCLPRRPT